MACTLITAGIARGCKDNIGGITRVFLANRSSVGAILPDDDSSKITSIAMLSSAKFFEFQPNKLSSNWVENIQSNVQNGTVAYEQVLTTMFLKNTATIRNRMKELGGSDIMAIVENKNGTFFLLGRSNGLDVTAGSSASGTAMADMNGWTITMTGYEKTPAFEVDSAIITTSLYTPGV